MPLVRYRKVVILGYRSVGESPPWGEHGRTAALWPEEARCRGNATKGGMVASLEWRCRARIERILEESLGVVIVCGGLQEAEYRRVNVDLAIGIPAWSPTLVLEVGMGISV